MPGGIPRWIRCYDNGGETADRFTVVFTGRYCGKDRTQFCLAMSAMPFHPQGVCLSGDFRSYEPIDRPSYSHLGKKIRFSDLPDDCRLVVLRDYKEIWGIR